MKKVIQKKSKQSDINNLNRKQVINSISVDTALEILKKLADEDANISKRIEELALESLNKVDPDCIAEDLFNSLNSIAVGDIWDNAGSTSYGYIEPYELASEMFEETLETYLDNLRKYQKLSMDKEAKLTCMGILKGLYKFEKEATTECKGYVEDDSYDNFIEVFDEWNEANKDLENKEEMQTYVKQNFPDWVKNVLK
jgi:hypothetical protein